MYTTKREKIKEELELGNSGSTMGDCCMGVNNVDKGESPRVSIMQEGWRATCLHKRTSGTLKYFFKMKSVLANVLDRN